ncbi:MAG: FCD domain-containing protein [Acidobacteriota bacterium]
MIGLNGAELEYRILEALAASTGKVGSGTLYLHLRDQNFQVSQATIGRALHDLDRRGITIRVSNQGRVLTAAGKRHLSDIRQWEDMRYWLEKIIADTRPGTQTDYTEALDALAYLEGHLARLAAVRATGRDLSAMGRILDLHEKKLNTMSLGREQGLSFHALMAKAARNKFLESAVNMIWSGNHDLRKLWAHAYPLTGRYSFPDHLHVFQAISRRDPARAERAMRAHYEIFTQSVRRHFGSGKKPKAAGGGRLAGSAGPSLRSGRPTSRRPPGPPVPEGQAATLARPSDAD